MKILCASVAAMAVSSTAAFVTPVGKSFSVAQNGSSLNMVLEKPVEKKISKLETLKVKSANLVHPLKEVRKAF